eukprot:8667994-Pyramimonas_sp.AAC.1
MAQILGEASCVWQRRGYGAIVGQALNGRRLTDVAFADDATLTSRTWASLRRMILAFLAALQMRRPVTPDNVQ